MVVCEVVKEEGLRMHTKGFRIIGRFTLEWIMYIDQKPHDLFTNEQKLLNYLSVVFSSLKCVQ